MRLYEVGARYFVRYRWKNGRNHHDFVGTYTGVKEDPALGYQLHHFDIGGGAAFYLGDARIEEAEKL